MKIIQDKPAVGEPLSIARARAAIENSLVVCGSCMSRLEFNAGVGPFRSSKEYHKGALYCFICEGRTLQGYRLGVA